MKNLSLLSKIVVLVVAAAGFSVLLPVMDLVDPALKNVWDYVVPAVSAVCAAGAYYYARTLNKVIEDASAACARAAKGDLEARILNADQPGNIGVMLNSINNVLDIADAFVRESSAALDYVANAKYFRKVLTRGMPGAYRRGATIINTAIDCMVEKVNTFSDYTNKLVEESTSLIKAISTAADTMLTSADSLTSASQSTSEQSVAAAASSEEVNVNVQTVSAAAEELSKSIMEIGRQVTRFDQGRGKRRA